MKVGNPVLRLKDPLYRNGTYLLLSSLSIAAIGFFFWMIASRFYPKADVGIATAIISSANLIIQISRLGIDQSIIRYYPTGNKQGIVGISLLVTTVVSLFISIIYLAGINLWSPDLSFLGNNAIEFALITVMLSIFFMIYTVFLASRKAEYGFLQNLTTGSRLILLLPLVSFGALGLFYSIGISTFIGIILALLLLIKIGAIPRRLDHHFIKDSLHFSIGNYLAGILTNLPVMIFPIMILNQFGAENTAEYYIAFTIASLLFTVSQSYSISLFVEGSYDQHGNGQIKRSLRIIFLILIPSSLVLIAFGEFILGFFGLSYVSGYLLLAILVISSFPYAIFSVILSICRVRKEIKVMILLSFITCFILLLSGYLFATSFGLIGIGYAWILAYSIGGAVYLFLRGFSLRLSPPHDVSDLSSDSDGLVRPIQKID